MFRTTGKAYRRPPLANSRGIALLVMLAFILVAFTTIAISRLALSSGEQKARAKTTQALVQAREAIMAFAFNAAVPGTLPCPDGDGLPTTIGNSDTLVAGVCPNQRGLVPYVALGIPQPLDGTGAPIWYVVATAYSGTPTTPHNSSKISALRLSSSPEPMAFILLAPNEVLGAQTRTSRNPPDTAVANFLEGENANATLNTYDDSRNSTQNDQVMGVTQSVFWTSIEGRVLRELNDALNIYFAMCTPKFPYAVPFGALNDDGVAPNTEGRMPFNLVALCPTATGLPGWLTNNWQHMFYYAHCAANCLDLRDNNNAHIRFATEILIAPGTAILPKARGAVPVITDYFELENASASNNIFTYIKDSSHTGTFNDRIFIVR